MKLYNEGRRSSSDVAREIRILKHLRGHPNIVTFIDSVRAVGMQGRGIVLEYIDHLDFRTLFPRFNSRDVCFYMRELAKALEFAHSNGVMHRDVRGHNVVINHENRQVSPLPSCSSYPSFQLMYKASAYWLGLVGVLLPRHRVYASRGYFQATRALAGRAAV